ncbi:S41 family peptidase [Sphingomicrobium arenosum]|uniref:S41 family peptidase n=1 Tax=Sphingomicrobium arenosum TaxID=2233861 RepID=UPI00223FC68A|nr:S41 family peptidase [Sphingomicrobium arenosum]
MTKTRPLRPFAASRPVRGALSVALAATISACATADARDVTARPAVAEQVGATTPAAERRLALLQLADLLEQMYVLPSEGERYAAFLRDRAERLDDVAPDPAVFAQRITDELRSIHEDRHLRLEVRQQGGGPGGPGDAGPSMDMPPSSLLSSEQLGHGIHYLRFDSLWGDEATMRQLDDLLRPNHVPSALIIDLRHNRGGGLREIDFLFSHLLTETTDLLVMEIRRQVFEMDGGPFAEGPNLMRIDSPETSVRLMHRAMPAAEPKLADTALILLTSPTTGSAAEHLALAVKKMGRGLLVGETTRGAGNFGGIIPISQTFQAFVPAGRTYDPANGIGWEGTGVSPDIAVGSGSALGVALERLGVPEDERDALAAKVEP